MGAISAIDIDLWDILGKYYNTPIYKLIGGKYRDRLRVYYHVSGSTTEELIRQCIAAKDAGFNGIGHLSPFLDEPRNKVYDKTYSQLIGEGVERVALIRDAIGYDMDIGLELHRRLTPAEAIVFGEEVKKYRPMFLEDPIKPDNFDDMAYVASKITVPIAMGERIHTSQEYDMLFNRRACSYARISICMVGGITGGLRIANLAAAKDIGVIPHNPLSPVSSMATMHFATAISNFTIMELPDHYGISATERYTSEKSMDLKSFSQADLVDFVPQAKEGYVEIPDSIGLGINLKKDIEKDFPFKRRKIYTRVDQSGAVVDQ